MSLYIPSISIATDMIVKAYLQAEYSKIKEVMDYIVNTPTIAGSADEYHNASVKLTRIEDYDNAVILLEHGLERYPRSTDILADLLLYGLKCRKIPEISPYYYERLSKISKKFWSWRSFHFSINFLMIYIQYADTEKQEKAVVSEIETLIAQYKEFYPNDERSYMVEHDFYSLINEKEKAKNALKSAVDKLKVCPQCALNYADSLFEIGDYANVIPIAQKAVDIREDQPSINLGYAYYILALSKEFVLRSSNTTLNQNNVKPVFDAYYSAMEFLESDKQHLTKQIEKRVKILERESNIPSDISFSVGNNAAMLKQILQMNNVGNIGSKEIIGTD